MEQAKKFFYIIYIIALVFTLLSVAVIVFGQFISVFMLNQELIKFFEDKLTLCTRSGGVVSISTFIFAYLSGWMSPKKEK